MEAPREALNSPDFGELVWTQEARCIWATPGYLMPLS